MSKSVVKKRLSKVNQDDLNAAQKKLDNLCKNYGLKPWAIDSGKANWRELILRISGIPPCIETSKKLGRPSRDDELVWRIGARINGLRSFSFLDEDTGQFTIPPYSLDKAIEMVEEEEGWKTEFYDSGREKNPKEVIRGIYYQFKENLKNGVYNIELDDDEWLD